MWKEIGVNLMNPKMRGADKPYCNAVYLGTHVKIMKCTNCLWWMVWRASELCYVHCIRNGLAEFGGCWQRGYKSIKLLFG